MAAPHFDVFLSHNSRDKPAVERIAENLRQHQIEPWLDKWHLAPGKSIQDGIGAGLLAAGACAVCLGPHGPGAWQKAELEVAQDRAVKDPDFQLFLVLLPGVPEPFDASVLPAFLNMRTWVDLRGGYEDPARFQPLINAIAGVASGPMAPVELEWGVSPYRGLQVFDEEHADFFFGRDADVQRSLEKIKSFRFLAVVGPSGSGKSSLVRAGLLPALRNGILPGSHDWPIRVFTPGARPLAALAAQLAQIDPDRPMGRTLDELRESPRTLDLATLLVLDGRSDTSRFVLVVDQFEEIFTLCHDEAERAGFLGNLLHAATIPDGRCIAILTLRADFYPRCAAYPDLATLIASHQVLLGPLDEQGLRAVIEQPARRVGVSFEPGLVDTILRDVGREPGALPLLEHALLELWERRQGTMLTLVGYRDSGGVDMALARRADAIFNGLSPAEQAVARRILHRLTQPGEETEDTRRRADLDERINRTSEREAVERVVDQLVAARLLTADQQADDGEVQVDVAHEALIRARPRLRAWLDEDREGFRVHRRITEAAQEWDAHQRDSDLLYRGARLAEAQALAARYPDLLNEQEVAFLAARVAARERELALAAERQAGQERQRRRIFAGLAIFALVALMLAGLAGWQWRAADAETRRADAGAAVALAAQATTAAQATVAATERNNAVAQSTRAAQANATAEARRLEADTARAEAEQQARIALSQQLAAQAATVTRPDLGLQLSAESMRLTPDSIYAQGSLFSQLVSSQNVRIVLDGQNGIVWRAAISPDGERIVSASDDGTITSWNVATGERIGEPWRGHDGTVWAVAMSPDGERVVSAGRDGTVRLWDTAAGTPVGEPWRGHEGSVFAVAFSPDGGRVISAGLDGTLLLWDTATGDVIGQPWQSGQATIWAVAFSPDGTTVVSGGENETIVAWEVATGEPIGEAWQGQGSSVYGVAFSPDGERVVSVDGAGAVVLWDAATGVQIAEPLSGHSGIVYGVAFSPNGTQLATSGADGSILLWEVATGEQIGEVWSGPEGSVYSVQYSRDGERLASASADGSVIVWDLSSSRSVAKSWLGGDAVISDLAFSPDGRILATVSAAVMVWDVETGSLTTRLAPVDTGVIWSLAFNATGDRMAISSQDGTVTVWDLATGRPANEPWLVHDGMVWSVAFSPDGSRIVTAGNDGTSVLLDAATGQSIGEPWRGHNAPVSDVAFSPDGQFVASVGGTVVLWDVATGHPTGEPWARNDYVPWVLAFSPKGTEVVTAGIDGSLVLWNVATGQPVGEPWRGHDGIASAVAFSPDGRWVASGGYDGKIVLWDVATGEAIGEPWPGQHGLINALHFSPDGTRLASGGENGTVTLWDVSPASWQAKACQIANRNLTTAEWTRYLGDRPYHETCPGKRGPPPVAAATPVLSVPVRSGSATLSDRSLRPEPLRTVRS